MKSKIFANLERPEYVRCAKIGPEHAPAGKSPGEAWCGRIVGSEWTFDSANHALMTGFTSSSLMLCHGCSVAIKGALKAVAYGPKRRTPGSREEDDDE